MDKLLPCPNPLCSKSLPHVEAFRVSCYTCWTGGAIKVNREDAIAAWNALPRWPQWTTFSWDDNATHPGDRDIILVERNDGSRFLLRGDHSLLGIMDGDRWIPWPGGVE